MRPVLADRNLTVLFVSTFLFFLNEALFLPTLPLHLSRAGYDNTRIGAVLGVFALGVLVARPLSGWVTDRLGRKISLAAGVFIFFAFPALYLVSAGFWYLMVVRFFHGLGIAFYTTAFPAYVADTAAPERRGEIMGHMATSTTLGFTFGPMLGAAVFGAYGFKYLVFLCTLTGLVNLAVILSIAESRIMGVHNERVAYRDVVFRRLVLMPSFIQLVHAVIFGGTMTFLPLLLDNVPGADVGVFFLVESILIIACRLLAAHLSDRLGKGPVFSYSFLIILAAVFLISRIDTFALMVAAAVLFGIGSALCAPSLSAYVADNSDPNARGTVFSFFSGAFDGGVIVAGLILGIVADLAGLRQMFAITSACGLLCLILFALFIRKNWRHSLAWAFWVQKR